MPCRCNWDSTTYLQYLKSHNGYSGVAIAGDTGSGKTSLARKCRLHEVGRRLITHLELDQWIDGVQICHIAPLPIPSLVEFGVSEVIRLGRIPILDFSMIDDPQYASLLTKFSIKLLTLPEQVSEVCIAIEDIMCDAIAYRRTELNCPACEVR